MTHDAAGLVRLLRGVARAVLPAATYSRVANERVYRRWLREGRPVPPPNVVKWKTVRAYGRRFGLRTFVETGTHTGQMVNAVRDVFDRIVSLELHPDLHRGARDRFRPYPHITILRGDSSTLLPILLTSLAEPCLFWLDAHVTGGTTGRGASDTPILAELRSILDHDVRGHVVLIDDARLFTGAADYPTIEEVERIARHGFRGGVHCSVANDVIRICPSTRA